MTVSILSRRRFLIGTAAAAGGFSLGFHLPFAAQAQERNAILPEVNAWVLIHPDDTVVVRIARSEMGQGTLTGLAQLVAEELECDWSKVTTEYPTPGESLRRNRIWGNFSTGGSRGIRESHEYVRQGGATAREMLVAAAATLWKVPVQECSAANSVITHNPSGRTVTYGAVASLAAHMQPPANVRLKDPKDWKIAGKPLPRLDTRDKLTGKQVYGVDLQLPGMLNASIKACPVFGGKVASFDAAAVSGMPGVRKVVQVDETAVAVVADTWWQAHSALNALPIVWDEGPNTNVTSETIAAMLREGLDAEEAVVGTAIGDVRAALAESAKVVTATYSFPYQAHATMEPMNATARYTTDKCEVWVPTQNGETSLVAAAEASGLPMEQCEVYKLHLGGGFGRRGAYQEYVRQAVRLAKEFSGTPVKLIWSREEDMLHGAYHPVTQCRLRAAIDKQGNVSAFHMRISGQSILWSLRAEVRETGRDPAVFQGLNDGGAEGAFGYTIANLLIDHAMRNPPVPPGFWRGVNLNQNALYVECFMDELAHEAGIDPLEFRRKLLVNHPNHLAVLDAVAERIGWEKPAGNGIHRGLAQIMGFGSYVAAAAEVSVTDGQLKIHRIVAATDPGHIVNPAQAERQVEGSFVYGLSACLYGECTINGGRVEQENFDTYEVMRMDQMPAVETILMPSGNFWGGVGEPTIAVAGPAVLNAVFAATGKRIRQLPLKNNSLGV
ncbi:xanthine dehydrogenase family protein molybdopterin-binding subunit [Sinorhizobium meliloti]|uniref:xanthine dehydrogenase family protein molybdopterin-binding subunit n=1 Tax=Rhizobium meliloti TaxID=382 RepID=UPI000B4A37AB|nr:molybdopterin cofactor-binding domain-containing protein [Sinorhizobium meliloti]ASP74422.1 aldehyde dehydrogenase [Sinorhizobium meliloti]MDE3857521.1 xanthine dehydrogenase family protein molybdopterin-binding subunit [Sinorhizobium meliloti]MQW49582.1 molybdopterin-dependent oxidoreductase [Sinorhizobium meliloti]MQW50450.1 molybdopterin-dependent oxidoreductase [Sinorhizobium meliloti]RVI60993.1 xanthine dehydrogenase family protein molybdopterin-binding subunit [Sinorhizobium meliloti]